MSNDETIYVRTSERGVFKTCRQKWYWSIVEGRRGARLAPALWFGDLVHRSLEAYYIPGPKRGAPPAETFLKLAEEGRSAALEGGLEHNQIDDHLDVGLYMMEGYVQAYAEIEEHLTVLASELPFNVKIKVPNAPKGYVRYVGRLDGVWLYRDTGKVVYQDFKTTGSDPRRNPGQLALDDQASAYWTFSPRSLARRGIIDSPDVLRGIEYTFLRKAKPDDRPIDEDGYSLNKDGSISARQPPARFHREFVRRTKAERSSIRTRVRAELEDMVATRLGERLPYKNPGPLHMPNCGFCGFRDACIAHEASAPGWRDILNFDTVTFDPYEEHR